MGEEKRAALTAVAAVLAGVLLVAVLVTWAASIGPSGVLTGEGPEVVRLTPTETTSAPTDVFSEVDKIRQRHQTQYAGEPTWLRAIAYGLEGALALGILYLLWRSGRRAYEAWAARRRPPPESVEVDFEVLDQARRALSEQIDRDAAYQRDLLLDGAPRNAIVECWHRFEQQAADAGLARRPWETSSEFTLRMLDLAGADTAAVTRLAAIYREARFSEHDLDETARARALEALDAVHHDVFGRSS